MVWASRAEREEREGVRDHTLLVTGGCGFIGSNFVLAQVAAGNRVVNVDKITYAGNPANLQSLRDNDLYIFAHNGIESTEMVTRLLIRHKPRAIVHFAAESHVDRSILGPEAFILTNVVGTFRLLETALHYWQTLEGEEKENFRFLHVSTDEVYGSLGKDDPAFLETTAYQPNSPYSASKAGSDHLVRAYHHTYGLPTLTTNCSNNYGPFQFPEKLIPLMIMNALEGKPLPVYGDGQNIRDWLYVGDHCSAIAAVLDNGRVGEVYNVGGLSEKANIDVVHTLCAIMDELHPEGAPHTRLITYVKDRPGHDRRYAVNCAKLQSELGWQPAETFEQGIRKTVEWYLANLPWAQEILSGQYRKWIEQNYSVRG